MSTADVVQMFNVPMIHYAIEDWRNAKERITQALPQISEEMLNSNGEIYTDFFDEQFKHCLPPYGETVIDILLPYLKDFTGKTRCEFTDMWFQTAKRGMSHGVHNHGASAFGWCYYVRMPEGASPICFPEADLTIHPKEGEVIIFPGIVEHSVPPSDIEEKRIMIASNVGIK